MIIKLLTKIVNNKPFILLIFLYISCFLLLTFVSPVSAAICGVGPSEGANCCPQGKCSGRSYGNQDCMPGELCCEACMGIEAQPLGILKGLGPLGFEGKTAGEIKEQFLGLFNDLISTIIGFLTVVAGIWFIFLIITAGYQWLSSGGDKAGVTAAREKLTYAITGLVIVVAAFAIVSIIGTLMGIDFLTPGETLKNFPLLGD